ncbi:hypothetical protein A2U01_0067885, partial [Trifolium medium]|nr:hypothetical protein [Trifolium medium]
MLPTSPDEGEPNKLGRLKAPVCPKGE